MLQDRWTCILACAMVGATIHVLGIAASSVCDGVGYARGDYNINVSGERLLLIAYAPLLLFDRLLRLIGMEVDWLPAGLLLGPAGWALPGGLLGAFVWEIVRRRRREDADRHDHAD